jgi:hypothetical protein
MILFTSAKLSSLLGIKNKLRPEEEAHPLTLWNAQLFSVDKRKCIITMNKATLCSLVALDVLKKDVVPFEVFFWKAFMTSLKREQLHTTEVEQKIRAACLPIHVSTIDNDKKIIGTINDHAWAVKHHAFACDHVSQVESEKAEAQLTRTPCGAIRYDYLFDRMKKVLENL